MIWRGRIKILRQELLNWNNKVPGGLITVLVLHWGGQRGWRTGGAPNENNRVCVPTPMPVPHFGMVGRING